MTVKLPAGYKPTEKEEYMNPKQLEYFRLKLFNWRKDLLEESRETIDHLKEENWHEPDIADRASLETEAGVELRTRNRYLKLISKIDSALRRAARTPPLNSLKMPSSGMNDASARQSVEPPLSLP